MNLVLLIVGALLAVAGVALIYIPAALIVGGVSLSVFALLWNFEERR